MQKNLFALSFGFAIVILATQHGFAQSAPQSAPQSSPNGPQCGAREKVVEHLATTYAESRRGIGIAANNTVMEMFASETGSWTITVTLPSGVTCLVASGQGYEAMADALPAEGTDS